MQDGEVPEYPVDAVIQGQGNSLRAKRQQLRAALFDLAEQLA